MPPKIEPTAFNLPIAKRILKATQLVERTFKSRVGPGQGTWQSWNPGCLPAVVTTAIPAGSLASPSTTGRVTTYRPDGAGGLEEDETDQECSNYHNADAAVGKTVTVYGMGDTYWLVAIDC